MLEWVNSLGAAGTIAMGLFGLIFPKAAAAFVGLKPMSAPGRSEFRATYGGLWLPLGLVPLISQVPIAFAIAGLCWMGAAMGRVASIFLDDAMTPKNWAAVVFECLFGISLLIGPPWAALVLLAG